jgi:hypothetical protein
VLYASLKVIPPHAPASTPTPVTGDRVSAPYSITAIDPHNKTPYLHQYHFGIEQQLASQAVLELYVGSAGHRFSCCGTSVSATHLSCLANPTSCLNNFLTFTSILDQENVGNSDFNSLQVRFEARN